MASQRLDGESQDAFTERLQQLLVAEREERMTERETMVTEREALMARNETLMTEREMNNRLHGDLSLPDYLHESHERLQNSIRVNTVKRETTTGDITDPTGKLCPSKIERWEEFPVIQKELWDELGKVQSTFGSEQCYDSRNFLRRLGSMIEGHPIGSEDDIAYVARLALETPVARILERMHQDPHVARTFGLQGESLRFENHGNAVSTKDELDIRMKKMEIQNADGQEEGTKIQGLTREVDPSNDRAYMYADQVCLYKKKDGENVLAFIIEYKAPHKLTLKTIADGLRPMSPFDDVVNRIEAADEKAKAEFQVAAAITQTYDYMVRSRLAYGYIFTGEALIFLYVAKGDPTTVRYHLSVPSRMLDKGTLWNPDAPASDDSPEPNRLHETALAQVTIFCLQALLKKPYSQNWCSNAKSKLKTWEQSDVEILLKIPMTPLCEVDASLFIPGDTPVREEITASPGVLRRETRAMKKAAAEAKAKAIQDVPSLISGRNDDGEDDSDGDHVGHRQHLPSDTPTPAARSSRGGSHKRGGRGGSKTSDSKKQQRDYCTQACILGLTQQAPLDSLCPNYDAHRLYDPDRHVLTRAAFLHDIRAQMAHDLDTFVHDLHVTGSRGAMFKITLATPGYTVMGKGTTYPWITDLKHEEAIYTHVRPLQGHLVPVCIGSIDLEWHYQYTAFEELEFMMFMAYGGMPLYKYEPDDVLESERLPIKKVALQAKKVMAELHRRGVAQRDVALRNLLWDKQAKKVMCIDFERSVLFGLDGGVDGKLGQDVEDPMHRIKLQKENVEPPPAAAVAAAVAATTAPQAATRAPQAATTAPQAATIVPQAPPVQQPPAPLPARQSLGEISPNASRKRKLGDGKQVHFSLPSPPRIVLQSSANATSATAASDPQGQPAEMEMPRPWKVILRNQYDSMWLSSWETEKLNEAKRMQTELDGWVKRMGQRGSGGSKG